MLSTSQMNDLNSRIDSLFSVTTPQSSTYDGLSNSALGRGIDDFTKKDYNGAIAEFKRSIALSPQSDYAGQSYDYLAQAYLQLNRTDDAIKTYKQQISSDPTNDTPHLNLGNLYFKSGDYKDAEQEYSQAVRIDPNSADNRYALGMTYLNTGKYGNALTQFQRLVQLSPTDPNAYDALGQALHKLGRDDEAVLQFQKAVSLDSTFADGYLDLGYTYADLKQTDNAQQEADILSKLDQQKASELTQYIQNAADPGFQSAFSTNGFPLSAGRNTLLSTMDDALATPGGYKDYTISFMFTKDMDPSSVQNPFNWQISRATAQTPGGPYNLGLAVPSTEITVPSTPYQVTYDAATRFAQITFRITQNADGDGTLDPSHLVFKFTGVDANGDPMAPSADEYTGFSKIV